MADYDFRSLSSHDFALLARDLLQAELGLRLESFAAGPDSGIDFRYGDDTTNLIVQCKHYADSGYAALTSVLRRKEQKKIGALNPTRYILATSVSLTPNNKSEINQILAPYCLHPADIYGRDDLNNLLSQHPQIERHHFKLWLTSETVLRRVLNAGIFSDSEAHLDHIRLRLRRYVQNTSFSRARSLLEKTHYCIVAGIPGIGKTTLAEVLLADLVDRQGFEAFRIAHSLDEIRPLKNSKRKQAFYFDDFLGKTTLEKLQRNEDQRLVELIEEVASNPSWRFILTTREYILQSARLRYEAFANPPLDLTLCVINLADYTRPIRARILYNHIYFSGLPKPHKLALLRNKGYEAIVSHRNYNPRVIEYMTDAQRALAIAPSLYLSEFKDSLEHPARIWDHAFRHQISEAARHLLLVLCTLPDEVLLADLEAAFWTFYRLRQTRFGFPTSSGDWNDALKQLDGNFVVTRRIGEDILVSFHNPSVQDFLEDFLSASDSDVMDLLRGAHFYEQYVALWEGKGGNRYHAISSHHEEFLRELQNKIFGPSAGTIRAVNSNGVAIGVRHSEVSNESRAAFSLRVSDAMVKGEAATRFLNALLGALEKQWELGQANREDLVRLLKALTDRGLKTEERTFTVAKRCLSSKIEEIGDFRAVSQFAESYPEELSTDDLDHVKTSFLEFARDYADTWEDDSDWLRQVAADLEFVGERIEIDVAALTTPLYERANEIESERANESEDAHDDEDRWESSDYSDPVNDMFEGLREELEDSP